MSFTIELPDRQAEGRAAWATCSPGESVVLLLRWQRSITDRTDLDPRPPPLTQCRARLRYSPPLGDEFLRPSVVELRRTDAPSSEQEEWVGRLELEAPRWIALEISAEVASVEGALIEPTRKAKALLIPRRCAVASTALLICGLIGLAVFGAVTFASLQLTLSSALPGISGATLLGFAWVLAGRLAAPAFPHWPPMLGLPYMLRRAIPAVFVAVACLFTVTQRFMASVRNMTRAQIEFRLPGRANADALAPRTLLTYMRPLDVLASNLKNDLDERYCVCASDECQHRCPSARTVGDSQESRWLSSFSPPRLEIHCAPLIWTVGIEPSLQRQLWRNDQCEFEPQYEDVANGDNTVIYKVRYPWSHANARANSRFAVLDVAADLGTITVESPPGVESDFRRTQVHAKADNVLLPIDARATQLAASVGASSLVCDRASLTTRFELWGIGLVDDSRAILRVVAEQRNAGSTSTWERLTATSVRELPVCSASPDSRHRILDKVRIWVDETKLEDNKGVLLSFPPGASAEAVEILSIQDDQLLSRLSCPKVDSKGLRVASPRLDAQARKKIGELSRLELKPSSSWTREGVTTTRPWACWVDGPSPIEATATLAGVSKNATLTEDTSGANVWILEIHPLTCHIDSQTGKRIARPSGCSSVRIDTRRYRRLHGGSCERVEGWSCNKARQP